MPLDIRTTSVDDAAIIARFAVDLTGEIMARTGVQHFDLDLDGTAALCRRLIDQGRYAALLAVRDGTPVGYAGLSVSHALYAGGTFGTVQEFYVVPEARSAGIGARLLHAVREYGAARGWTRLELCTPPLPEFDRTVSFYERNGFAVTGGRKMRALL